MNEEINEEISEEIREASYEDREKVEPKPEKEKKNLAFRLFLVVLCIVFLAVAFFFKPVLVEGKSMENTLFESDYAYSQRYIFEKPKRYDIAVIKVKKENRSTRRTLVKRVIGLPGDHLTMKEGKLYINGEVTEEPYICAGSGKDFDVVLAEKQYFVMGDNRGASFDSRNFGAVKESEIISRVFYILLPFDRSKSL